MSRIIKSRTNNLIVLVEFLLKFTSNNAFQLFLDVSLNFSPLRRSPRLNWHLKLKLCTRALHFFQYFVNVLGLVMSGF